MGIVYTFSSQFGGIIGAIASSGVFSPYLAMLVTGAIVSLIHYAFKGVKHYD